MSTSRSSLFVSLPLTHGQFRALRISQVPGEAASGEELELSMAIVDLSHPMVYDALSYTWGDPTAGVIEVGVRSETGSDRATLSITKSLHIALVAMLETERDTPIFIDQLCIDQANETEKSQQIKIMEQIYIKANRVLAWLGPSTESADRYLGFVEKLGRDISNRGLSPVWENKRAYIGLFEQPGLFEDGPTFNFRRQEKGDEMVSLVTESANAQLSCLDGLHNILGRPWFSRLWIVQEACLNVNLVFACGAKRVSWRAFRIAIDVFALFGQYWAKLNRDDPTAHDQSQLIQVHKTFPLQKALFRLNDVRFAIKSSNLDSLGVLVRRYCAGELSARTKATDPKDYIFALLGIAGEDDLKSRVLRELDYTEHFELIYVRFAAMLLERKELDTLLYSQGPKRSTKLPSWVPDWSSFVTVPTSHADLKKVFFSAGGPAGDVNPRVTIDIEHGMLSSGVLHIQGLQAGIIRKVGRETILSQTVEEYVHTSEFWQAFGAFDKEIEEFLAEAASPGVCKGASDTGLLARGRLVTSGLFGRYGVGNDELMQAFHQDCRSHAETQLDMKEQQGLRPPDFSDQAGFGRWQEVHAKSEQSTRVLISRYTGPHMAEWIDYQYHLKAAAERRLFLTDTGLLGLSPTMGKTKVGDLVVVLHGVSAPVALREVGKDSEGRKQYIYIGEVYCDGIMDGELVGTKEPAWFSIV